MVRGLQRPALEVRYRDSDMTLIWRHCHFILPSFAVLAPSLCMKFVRLELSLRVSLDPGLSEFIFFSDAGGMPVFE